MRKTTSHIRVLDETKKKLIKWQRRFTIENSGKSVSIPETVARIVAEFEKHTGENHDEISSL